MNEREQLVEGAFLGFSPKLAASIGLNEAIFLNQLHYWSNISKNERDGFIWVYKTVDEWLQEFPFWKKRTLERIIKKLEEIKILVAGNYNKMKMDRTKWYRIDYETLNKQLENANRQNGGMETDKLAESTRQNGGMETDKLAESTRQNGGMETDKLAESTRQNGGMETDKLAETTRQNDGTNNHNITHYITQNNTSLNHNKNNQQQITKTERGNPPAPNIPSSVDIGPGGGRTVVGGRSLSYQEKLKRVKESYEFTIGPVDGNISKSLKGLITLYKDYRLIIEALKELAQTAPPNTITVNNIPTIIGKWKENGIYTYEQLMARQESDNLVESSSS